MQTNTANAMISALKFVTRDWARQRKAEERDRSRQANRYWRLTKSHEVKIKEAAYAVMEAAYMKASANNTLKTLARQVFYQARPLVQKHTVKPLIDSYFTQTLLPDYIKQYNKQGWKIGYDERGHILEPHT